jgi:2-octaprenyl-6-methoxyphenol hydroxylase
MDGDGIEVAVVGGGPSGLTAAIALASAGVQTVLIAPPYRRDNRTTALLGGSVAALEALGVWRRCAAQSAPLAAMRIIDDRGGLLRAPEVIFHAREIGREAFGHNIENTLLVDALTARAAELPALTLIEASASHIVCADDAVAIALADGRSLSARLAVGADGRSSPCRKAAGIATDDWSYRQVALTMNVSHRRPHKNISTEFHTTSGPFTLVPLPGDRSSLVWVVTPAEAERLSALDDAALAAAAERRAHSLLGRMQLVSGRGAFPLSGRTARRFAQQRVALVGEAAHVIPPVGAQGLNLGLRDAALIAELAAQAHRAGGDVGGGALLDAYDRRRRRDVQSRTLAVDLLNRSLLSDFLPVQGLRGLGLALVDSIGPLRRAVMREGIAPRLDEPQLMRGVPL